MEKDSSRWISHLTALIEPQTKNPMWKGVDSVEWDQLGAALGVALEEDLCTVFGSSADWKKESELLDGLGDRPISTPITLSPLSTPVYWVMPAEDAKHLARVTTDGPVTFVDPEIQKSFYRYLILEALDATSKLSIMGNLSPKLGEAQMPNEPAYCVDVEIAFGGRTVWGRIVCPQSFHAEFEKHSENLPTPPIDLERARDIPLSLSLRLGHTDLTFDQWKQIQPGDFLKLDHCTYSPKKHKGTAALTLNETPLFSIKVKEGKLKIFDYLYTSQQEFVMDEFSDEELLDETPPPIEPILDDDFEEEAEIPVTESEPEEIVNPKSVPLTIQVEVARLKMTLEELLQLKPGNALALSVKPHEGVNLVLNGKRVGKGELYQLGETLGVKVTEIN